MSDLVVVPRATLLRFEDLIKQRIYTNANPLVRRIFWKRLALLLDFSDPVDGGRALAFGCGEGAISPSLCRRFREVAAVDLEVAAPRNFPSRTVLSISLLPPTCWSTYETWSKLQPSFIACSPRLGDWW